MAYYEIAADIGAKYVKLGVVGTDKVIKEPSVLAVSVKSGKVEAVGLAAEKLCQANKTAYSAVRPISDGVPVDKGAAAELIKRLVGSLLPQTLYEPQIKAYASVNCGMTVTNRRVLESVLLTAGMNPVVLTEGTVAASKYVFETYRTGCGLIVDIGYDKTDLALIENGKIIGGCTVMLGSKHIDMGIQILLEEKGLMIDEVTASKVKEKCASFNFNDASTCIAKGIDIATGAPSETRVNSHDFTGILTDFTDRIVYTANSLYNGLSREKQSVLKPAGLFIVGGGAGVYDISRYFAEALRLPARVPQRPGEAIVRGLMMK